jgi:hypothetical protein
MTVPRILGTAATLVLSAVVLAGCAGSPDAQDKPDPVQTRTSTADPGPEPTVTPTPVAEDPTCDTLIRETVVADFESLGWTSQQGPLYIGGTEVPDGLQCMWADFEGPAGDHGQMFGWAPLSDDAAADAQQELLAQGWIREEAPDGVYITEAPETTIATDADGYGITYLFTEGQVTVADTKQGLLLIEWPKS